MSDKVYALPSVPGVGRDGTVLDRNFYVDGQWCRFQRGRPKKMGGYKEVNGNLPNIQRGSFVFMNDTIVYCYSFGSNIASLVKTTQNVPTAGHSEATLPGLTAADIYTFQVGKIFDALGTGTSVLLLHAANNVDDIANRTDTNVLMLTAGTDPPAFTAITDGLGSPVMVSGGVTVLQPFVFAYGNDGLIRNSNANNPNDWRTDRDRLRFGQQRADGYRRTQAQAVRVEEAGRPVATQAGAEVVEQFGLDVGDQEVRQHADEQFDQQRHVTGRADLDVMADAPVAVQRRADLPREARRQGLPAQRVDDHVRGVPAAAPLERGGGTLQARLLRGEHRIVIGDDGTQWPGAERARRIKLHLGHAFRIGAAAGRQRIARLEVRGKFAGLQRQPDDAVAADVADAAIADARSGAEEVASLRLRTRHAVAEAQVRNAIVVDLDHEVAVVRAALQQVVHRLPLPARIGHAVNQYGVQRTATDAQLRQRLARIAGQQLAHRRSRRQRFGPAQRSVRQHVAGVGRRASYILHRALAVTAPRLRRAGYQPAVLGQGLAALAGIRHRGQRGGDRKS